MKKAIHIFLFFIVFSSSLMSQDSNATMSDEEFMKQFMSYQNQIEKDNAEIKAEREKTKIAVERRKAVEQLSKTVDKLAKTVGADKK